jgi:hypothetical protein
MEGGREGEREKDVRRGATETWRHKLPSFECRGGGETLPLYNSL